MKRNLLFSSWVVVSTVAVIGPPTAAAEPAPSAGAPAEKVVPPRTKPGRGRRRSSAGRMSRHSPWTKKKIPQIGPFVLRSADRKSAVAFRFTAQFRVEFNAVDLDPVRDTEAEALALFRRIRPALTGTLFTRDLFYLFHLSTAPGQLEFMDLYLDYKFCRHLQVEFGQHKIPFTRYRDGSFRHLTLVDWSIVSPFFGAERQFGFTAHNAGSRGNRFVYFLGVYTGVNARAAHALGVARVYGEKPVSLSSLQDGKPVDTVHPELVLRLSYRHRGIKDRADTDAEGGPFRFSPSLSVAWDLRPDPYLDFALRVAPEFLMKAYGWSLFYAAYLGFIPWGDAHLEQRYGAWGALAQTSYLFRRFFEVSARYSVIQIGRRWMRAARARADDIVAAAVDPDERGTLMARYAQAGLMRRHHEATLGFNWYLIGASLKWQTDVSWLGVTLDSGTRHDFRLRTQLQVSF